MQIGAVPVRHPRDTLRRIEQVQDGGLIRIIRTRIDLGQLTDRDKDDAFAAAAAYVQPSAMESFSRTVMEAWLAGTPVIANAVEDALGVRIKTMPLTAEKIALELNHIPYSAPAC